MKRSAFLALIAAIMGLAACSTMQVGGGSAPVTGSAGANGNAQGAGPQLVQCAMPIGTLALVERQYPALAQWGLTSPVPLIRLMAAQSNCFNIVERGQALSRMMEERGLAESGLLQSGSNVGRGQMVAADYMVTPNVVFSENNAGKIGASLISALGGYIPGAGGSVANVAASVIGNVRFKEAQAVMMVTDTRSGVQVAVAEGRAKATDLGGGLGLGSLSGLGSLAGYSNTSEGKVVAGAFLDAFNKLADQIRALPNR
jgi:hypothetical protein